VYLITGGTGGVGLTVAAHLARTVQARVALVSRTPPNAATRLERTVCDDAIRRLAELEDGLEEKHRASLPLVREAGLEATLDRLCAAQILDLIRRAGIDIASSDGIGREELKARCRSVPQFERLFSRLLRGLEEAGLAALDGPAVRFAAAAAEWPPASALRGEAAARYPHMTAVFDLLDRCGHHYPDILCGEKPALGALFGEGSELFTRAVAAIREHSDIPVCQALIGELFSHVLRGTRTGALRVLEVGGGEGLLTRALVPLCDGQNVEYHFTDIGRSFVVAAQREAAARGADFMRFGVLDISRPAAPQGYTKGAYDVVLAFNVLHATRNLSESLAHAAELLAPGGLLVVQESVRPRLWIDFIWGLTDGWWAFEDEGRRHSSSPLMSADSWVETLRAAGFESITSLPTDGGRRASADTAVVIARKPLAAKADRRDGAGAAIEALERDGAEVMVLAADAADRAQMREAIDRVVERFGRIDGVIHAALVLEDGTIQSKTRDSARRVLAPKVTGTLVLEEALAGRPLDFFVMFSSLVSQMGGAGQIDYCAASHFQDAFAHANRSRLAKAVISINWGAWREVGKAFRSAVERGIAPREALPDGMSPAEGLDAFIRVLACPYPQVVVSPQDPVALWSERPYAAGGRVAASDGAPPAAVAATDALPGAGVLRNDTERVIADIWRDVLGVDRIGIEDNFFDLGADSVISLQFIARARKAGLRFTNQQVFEHQTVAGLAAAAANGHRDTASKGREL
jgi:NAD(P)-dependent dehydrogenase (short-subunit alcohol dehydrogenase family)